MNLPEHLRVLEADLRRYGSRLRDKDWKALREGQCHAVAAKLRRRASVGVWLMGSAVAVLAIVNFVRALGDANAGRLWPWFGAFQSLIWVGIFVAVFLRSRAARALADRLDELGDAP